jgi:glycosyltransferase involved in cell wall biosynthesis
MATLDRSGEVESFIGKLLVQTYKYFELLIIDQNADDRVFDIYKKYADKIEIKYFRSKKKGISINRNIGLENCSGDIIAFPDDDCEYNHNTLEKIFDFFVNNTDYNFCTCNTVDPKTNTSDFHGKRHDTEISLFNLRQTGISFTIFIRSVCLKNFKFDDLLGVGAEYGSAEESDMLLYLLRGKNRGFYFAGMFIAHPYKEAGLERSYAYGKGLGALYKKGIKTYGFKILFFVFLFILLKNIIAIVFFSSRKSKTAALRGRLSGFIHYPAVPQKDYRASSLKQEGIT